MQVRATRQQLGLATQAGGADDAAGGQRLKAVETVGNESITRVFTLADAVQAQAFGEVHGHVLHRMHGDVGFVVQQGGFQFLDEQALAADLRQRRVEQLVATADHGHQGHQQTGVGLLEAGFDVFGLPQGQGTFTGGNADFASGHGTPRSREMLSMITASPVSLADVDQDPVLTCTAQSPASQLPQKPCKAQG
ncbi:hypothetical protein D3C79_688580 [compost metagenome]